VLQWDGDLLRGEIGFQNAITPIVANGLHGGTTETVLRAYVIADGNDWPVAMAAQACRITYDSRTGIRVDIASQESQRSFFTRKVDEVASACFCTRAMPIVMRTLLVTGRSYRVLFAFDVNRPLLYESARRWTTRGLGNSLPRPGEAYVPSTMIAGEAQWSLADSRIALRTLTGMFVP
jgi:hypothetical protein